MKLYTIHGTENFSTMIMALDIFYVLKKFYDSVYNRVK